MALFLFETSPNVTHELARWRNIVDRHPKSIAALKLVDGFVPIGIRARTVAPEIQRRARAESLRRQVKSDRLPAATAAYRVVSSVSLPEELFVADGV